MTKTNVEYVSALKIQEMLDTGYKLQQIALKHNAGEMAVRCKSGYNKHGVYYDSCAYVNKALKIFNQIK